MATSGTPAFVFRNFNGHLAQFKYWDNSPDSWEDRWAGKSLSQLLATYSAGRLDEYEIILKYLPKHLPVLEAGCGMGQYVMALHSRGYHVKGIDYACRTIERIKEVAPQLDVRVGDVYSLDMPTGSLGGYISLGVFEHNPDGPLKALIEAKRVLHPDGVAFIAVPFLNSKRKKLLNGYNETKKEILENGLKFYQYYFSIEEFKAFLDQAGLSVLQVYPHALYTGLTRDFTAGQWLHSRGFIFSRLERLITWGCRNAPLWVRRRWAHMIMFICKRANSTVGE